MQRVDLSITNQIATVTLSRPEKHNALDLPMFREIVAVGEQLLTNKNVRAVVLTGAGPSFCAGLDILSVMQDGLEKASSELLNHRVGVANLAQRVSWIWQEIEVPVIAALHGVVYGGGLQIALGADIRVAHPNTKLSVREIHWGLIPDMGITKTLLRHVRLDHAKQLTFTGEIISAQRAETLGLITTIADEPTKHAVELATTIAGRNPDAVVACKALFNQSLQQTTAQAFALETRLQREILGSENQLEAVMANTSRRQPKFSR